MLCLVLVVVFWSRSKPDLYLPVSHTCFFTVDLPRYSTKEILKTKLKYAIFNCIAIDGDDTDTASRNAALGFEDAF